MSKKLLGAVGSMFVGGALLLAPLSNPAGASVVKAHNSVKAHATKALSIDSQCLILPVGPLTLTVCLPI
jgi:hypothetical protein